jgi:hypothetical protein
MAGRGPFLRKTECTDNDQATYNTDRLCTASSNQHSCNLQVRLAGSQTTLLVLVSSNQSRKKTVTHVTISLDSQDFIDSSLNFCSCFLLGTNWRKSALTSYIG